MTTFTDDFNRADAATLGANWVAKVTDMALVSNQASTPSTATITERIAAALATPTMYAQATLPGTTGASVGIIARSDAAMDHYYATRVSTTDLTIFRNDISTVTTLAGPVAITRVAGAVLRIEVETVAGNAVIRAYYNGALVLTYTDSSAGKLTSGNYAGLRGGGTTGIKYDDFSAGDYTASTGVSGLSAVGGTLGQVGS